MEKIPWWKSQTIRALVIAGLAQVISMFGLTDKIGMDDLTVRVDQILDLISLIATAYAAYARTTKANPPVTDGAAQKEVAMQQQLKVEKGQGGFVSIGLLLTIVAILGTCIALSGCAGTKAAYDAADTLDERAYVVTEHYAAVVKEAADLKDKGVLKDSALSRVQEAESVTRPIVLGLGPLVRNFKAAQNAESEVALQKALDDAVLALADLVRLVKSAATGGA